MDVNLQEKEGNSDLPVLARNPSYGEKVYGFVFGNLINFWVNLAVSAGFTYFVKHSKNPVFGAANPDTFYHNTADGIHKVIAHVPGIGEKTAKGTSKVMADALLLTTGGTAVMIPSVWLGAKIKAPFVKFFDRMHYGKDAVENDPSLQARHARLETETKPTLLGAVVARFAAMGLVQLSAFTIGYKDNWISNAGKSLNNKTLQKFHGVDAIAEKVGDGVAHGIVSVMPTKSATFNEALFKRGYGEANGSAPKNTGRALEDFAKYASADTLYTLVTALSIGPIVGLLKNLPGMSYKGKPSATKAAPVETTITTPPVVNETPAARRDDEKHNVPKIRVSDIKHNDRIQHQQLHQGVSA